MSLTFELELDCEGCGESLELEATQARTTFSGITIRGAVVGCKKCAEKARSDGFDEGRAEAESERE